MVNSRSSDVPTSIPGAVLGAILGTGLQGKVSARVTRWFFSALFLTIGVTFLLAFTVFKGGSS